jgi:hypothetical protein
MDDENTNEKIIQTVVKSDETIETQKKKVKRTTRKRRHQKTQQGGGSIIDDWLNTVKRIGTFTRQPSDDYNILDSLNQDSLTNGNLKISHMTPGISDNGNDFGIRDRNTFVSPTSLYDVAATVHCIIKDLLTQGGATAKGFHAKITEMDTPDRGFSDVVSYLNIVENAIRGPNNNTLVNIKDMKDYPLYIWALAAFVDNVDCINLKPMLFTQTDEQKMARNEVEQPKQQPAIQQMQEPYPQELA